MTAPATAPTTQTLSNVITNLDATPIVRARSGRGAPGRLIRQQSTITPTASQATSVLNRMVRVPSNCTVTRVALLCDTPPTTLTGNVGVWYSDLTSDGTSGVNAGNLTAISSAFFAYQLAMATFAAVPGTDPSNTVGLGGGPIEITYANSAGAMTDGQYIPSAGNQMLWKAIANSLALQTTPVGAFTSSSSQPHFLTASAGASVFVRSDDPGGFFDICLQLSSTGSGANVAVTLFVDYVI